MEVDDVPGLFFARQVIQNACATQAIISVLLNSPSIELGEELSNFKSFTVDLPPDMRGLSLASAETIRAAHNSFGRPEAFELPDVKPDEKEEDDAFHFVSFIPFNGNLYELDGLKPAPVCHGPCTDDDWLEKAVPVIQERIQSHSHEEIRFNLSTYIVLRLSMIAALASNSNRSGRYRQPSGAMRQTTDRDGSAAAGGGCPLKRDGPDCESDLPRPSTRQGRAGRGRVSHGCRDRAAQGYHR